MGVCCGKDAMPVVEDDAAVVDQQQKRRSRHQAASNDPIQFDYVFDGRHDPSLGTSSVRRSHSPNHDALGYTPRELDTTTVLSAGTTNARSMGALSFITNGNQDVSYDYIGRFVERIRDGDVDPFEGSVLGGSFTAGTVASQTPSRGVQDILSREQLAYLEAGPDVRSKLLRLIELEESHRVDVIAAHRMNAMICTLASQKMVPTVRKRKTIVAPVQKKKVKRKSGAHPPQGVPPVVVIHAHDINIEFANNDNNNVTGGDGGDDDEGYFDQTIHSLAGTLDRTTSVLVHSVRGARREGGNRLADDVDDNGLYSPASAVLPPPPMEEVARSTQQHTTATPHPQQVEHFEMLALSAREVSITADVKGLVVTDSWDFLSLPRNAALLNDGSALYKFVSKPAHQLDAESLEMLRMFINVSGFADETIENNVPRVDCGSVEDLSKYVTILAKAMYVLPGVRLASINKELLASLDYQRNCQAGETKFHDNITAPFTFRQTKTIIKFLFSLVIQMRVSEITDPQILNSFKDFDGIIPAKAILLERTKKNIAATDSTAKCKSILLYYPINDGLLVSHGTIVLNTSLPGVVSKILHSFGGQGAKENADAVRNTRRYLIHRFGDSREGLSSVL